MTRWPPSDRVLRIRGPAALAAARSNAPGDPRHVRRNFPNQLVIAIVAPIFENPKAGGLAADPAGLILIAAERDVAAVLVQIERTVFGPVPLEKEPLPAAADPHDAERRMNLVDCRHASLPNSSPRSESGNVPTTSVSLAITLFRTSWASDLVGSGVAGTSIWTIRSRARPRVSIVRCRSAR